MKEKFDVTGMSCAACVSHVEKAVKRLDGVQDVSVSLMTNSMTVHFSDSVTVDAICSAVAQAGYHASLKGRSSSASPQTDPAAAEMLIMKRRLIASVVLLIPLFYLGMGHMLGFPLPAVFLGAENTMVYCLAMLLLVIPILCVNLKYYRNGIPAFVHGSPNMDSLIAVGSGASFVYSIGAMFLIAYRLGHGDAEAAHQICMNSLYLESVGMILALIDVGKYLETRSRSKTGDAISRLIDLAPKTAVVIRGSREIEIPADQLQVGDLFLVRPGSSVPVDGVVEEGTSSVDESALTGESIPAEKHAGDSVLSASVNRNGVLKVRASKVGDNTTLSQMVRLVEEAAGSKAPIARLADQVAAVFVPVVMSLALITFVIWLIASHDLSQSVTSAVSVLVISCPCALGLATPVAIMVGTGKGAEYGILFRSAEALENMHRIDTVVLDKTGTVTEGTPVVTDIIPADGITENQLLSAAASLEAASEHPLAEAVMSEANKRSVTFPAAENFSALPGRGVRGIVGGLRCSAGSSRMMEELGIRFDPALTERLAREGKTPLFFEAQGEPLGCIAAADLARPSSKKAVDGFHALGMKVVMLTGDNRRTAQAVAEPLGIDEIIAEVLPQDKEKTIASLKAQGHKVAMIGDGINDAPALASADVGIAIGAGTDIAIESADLVLMKSNLCDAVTAAELSRKTIRNIKENLFWAFFYNCIGIPLAAGAWVPLLGIQLTPMFGAAAMSLSSFCVVTNALRLRGFRPKLCPPDVKSAEAAAEEIPAEIITENKGETAMEKKIMIEGMMCKHCVAHVEKALNAVEGVSEAKADLDGKCAVVTLTAPVDDAVLTAAVVDAGYDVTGVC